MNRRSKEVDVYNNGFRKILLPGAATAATAAVVAGGGAATAVTCGGLLGECRECREVATLQ